MSAPAPAEDCHPTQIPPTPFAKGGEGGFHYGADGAFNALTDLLRDRDSA